MENFQTFVNALVDSLYSEYQSRGIRFNQKEKNLVPVLADYFSLLDRMVAPVPRKVKFSDTIQTEIANDQRLAFLVTLFKEKIENGDDINNHLSTTIFDSEYDDSLFNGWGIKHIHLSVTEAASENQMHSSNRSSDLLMAVIDNSVAYFLTVKAHGDWFIYEYLEIIERNWKEELLREEKNVIPSVPIPRTNKEIKALRKAHINVILYDINGKYYTSKKMNGFMLNGQSMNSLIKAQTKLKTWEKFPFRFASLHFCFGDENKMGWVEDDSGRCHNL